MGADPCGRGPQEGGQGSLVEGLAARAWGGDRENGQREEGSVVGAWVEMRLGTTWVLRLWGSRGVAVCHTVS